jgi:hypothetical protein
LVFGFGFLLDFFWTQFLLVLFFLFGRSFELAWSAFFEWWALKLRSWCVFLFLFGFFLFSENLVEHSIERIRSFELGLIVFLAWNREVWKISLNSHFNQILKKSFLDPPSFLLSFLLVFLLLLFFFKLVKHVN